MLMNISLKKRTLLVLLSGLTATFTLAQQQPLPEWQSQYAVGLNKLAPQDVYKRQSQHSTTLRPFQSAGTLKVRR